MAFLIRSSGAVVKDRETMEEILGTCGVSLEFWPVQSSDRTAALLSANSPGAEEMEEILSEQDRYFQKLREALGYQTRDLVVVYPELPGLSAMLDRFRPIHYHEDDEVRYVVDGEGVFGFVLPDGDQVELLVEKGDFIRVPRLLEHWFRLTETRRIKAIRYFTGTAGWVPVYTGTPSLFSGETARTA